MPLNPDCCPICKNSSIRQRYEAAYDPEPKVAGVDFCANPDAKIMECKRCSFRFITPMPDFESIGECYRKADANVWKSDDHFNSIRRRFPQMINALVENSPPEKSVLDIGCYTGSFLTEFPDDWSLCGVEPGGKAAEFAKEHGVEIITGKWEGLGSLKREFGCVVSLSVIEHISSPSIFIDAMKSVLKKNGLLLIETGDYDSYFPRFMGGFWRYYHLPEHVSFFSSKGIVDLLEEKGLEVIEVKTGLFHKRPYGIKQWIVFGGRFVRLMLLRALSLIGFSKPIKSSPPIAFAFDHVCVIARKK